MQTQQPGFDVLELSVQPDDWYPVARVARGVRMIVNGEDMLKAIRAAELPFYEARGHPEVAGDYVMPPLEEVAPPSGYFHGNDGMHGDQDHPRAVSLCVCAGCGDRGCSDWGVWIDANDETVTWSNIGNWRPGMASTRDALGPFTFERGAYDREVTKLTSALEAMFAERLAFVRRAGTNPALIVAEDYGGSVARQPWALAVRFEQPDDGGRITNRGFALWVATSEDKVLERKAVAAQQLGVAPP